MIRICLILLLSHLAMAVELRYPADSGVIDLGKPPYSLVGDGRTDVTAAFQRAISDHLDSHRILWLPKGVYVVSDTLAWRRRDGRFGGWDAWLALHGESRDGTVIRLVDRAAGFADPAQPKAVLQTASRDDANAYNDANGEGNQAFSNHLRNVTVEVGSGNPGAIGIDWQASNTGRLCYITIRARDGGAVGLACGRRDNGPALITRVAIEGFDTGMTFAGWVASMVVDDVELSGQRVLGIRNDGHAVQIRRLRSRAPVPVLRCTAGAHTVVIDADLQAGAAVDGAAIINGGKPGEEGVVLLRDVVAGGFARILDDRGVAVPGQRMQEYATNRIGEARTLRLPVRQAPEPWFPDHAAWARVDGTQEDDTAAIQAAFAAGRPVVYFPRNSYHVSGTIEVPAGVRLVHGLLSSINAAPGADMAGKPFFRMRGAGAGDVVRFEQFTTSTMTFAHEDGRTLVLADLELMGGTTSLMSNAPGAGPLFIDDLVGGPLVLDHPQQAWIRQISINWLRNGGGTWWILGLEGEGVHTFLDNRGGTVEILGGLRYPCGAVPADLPMIRNAGGVVSASLSEASFAPPNGHRVLLETLAPGGVRQVLKTQAGWRGLGSNLGLASDDGR